MKITFGIITGDKNLNYFHSYFKTLLDSIKQCNIFQYEIIIVGPEWTGSTIILDKHFDYHQLRKHHHEESVLFLGYPYIQFDESKKPNWITRKKNLIAQHAQYENIVFMHDYVVLDPKWYRGFLDFGTDWDVCMNRISNLDGKRFRDWTTWDDPDYGGPGKIYEKWCPYGLECKGGPHLVDYSYDKTHFMYVSGTYWVAKKQFMLDNPLNENLSWGEGEDVEWSLRVRDKWKYKINTMSEVHLLKQK